MGSILVVFAILAIVIGLIWVVDVNNKRGDLLAIEDPTLDDLIADVINITITLNGTIDHDNTTNRNLPENHPQYLLLDGTRNMEGYLQIGEDGSGGNFSMFSEQGATDRIVNMVTNSTMLSSTFYTLPVDVGTSGYCLKTNGLGNLVWDQCVTAIAEDDDWRIFDFNAGDNLVAIGSDQTMFWVSRDFVMKGSGLAKKVNLTLNASDPQTWNAKHNFTHQNTSIRHDEWEPSRALGTIYQNLRERTIMVYGSVQFITRNANSQAYSEAFTSAESILVPNSMKIRFGTGLWGAAIAQTRVDTYSFMFVVQPNDYYKVNSTVALGGTATLITWNEVLL